MQKITPFLWFDTQAEEAANYYTSVFRNSKIKNINYYGDGGPNVENSTHTDPTLPGIQSGLQPPNRIAQLLLASRLPPAVCLTGGLDTKGTALTVAFELDGTEFTALNGGPVYKFNEAVSFYIHCKDQAEIDYYWDKLTEGGQTIACGWLKDKYGLAWQVVPEQLGEYLSDKDAAKAQRVMNAMMKMVKIDLPALQKAYEG